jgi:3-oxoadipate enol-lactonase
MIMQKKPNAMTVSDDGKHFKINVNNLSVSYTDHGPPNAPVIIFIHGFPLNNTMWNGQVEVLKADYRVITYDIRGHGNSDPGDEVFSIVLFVNDLINLMDALKINHAILCGLSMGGYIALKAIIKYPDRFDALVLCDTNCIADSAEAKEKRKKAIESIKEDGVDQYAVESLKKLFSTASYGDSAEAITAVKEMIMGTSVAVISYTLQALAGRSATCSKLAEIKVPVLILVGKEDELTPPSAAEQIHEGIKDSELHIIENAGHLSNLEQPDVFNEHLLRFVTGIDKRAKQKKEEAL